MPTAVFDKDTGVTREQLLAAFQAAGIDARVFFHPLSSLPPFTPAANPVAYGIAARAINLPSYHDMTLEEQRRVVSVLEAVSAA
jgi:perosamine synthetase